MVAPARLPRVAAQQVAQQVARGVARQARQARQARLAMEAPATNPEILTKGAHDPMLKYVEFYVKNYVKYTNRIKYVYTYIYIYIYTHMEDV